MPLLQDLERCYSILSYDHNDQWSYPSRDTLGKKRYTKDDPPALRYHHESPYNSEQFKRIIKFYYNKDRGQGGKRPHSANQPNSPYWRDQKQRRRSLIANQAGKLRKPQKLSGRPWTADARTPSSPVQQSRTSKLAFVSDMTKKLVVSDVTGQARSDGKSAHSTEADVKERQVDSASKSSVQASSRSIVRGMGSSRNSAVSRDNNIRKMGDSDSERGAGSDMEDDDEPGFDPTADLDKMTDKERKKWEKNLDKWRIFMDFLFRHVAIATFKYNCFEQEEWPQFMIALEKAEELRGAMKLKKGDTPRIACYKVMRESCELLKQHKFISEANRIRKFLDICGRMKGISMIAGGFYKALKKGKVRGLDKIKYYLDYWKGFCVRSFDYGELQFRNTEPESFNELEQKYMVWNASLRTTLNLSQKFLKKCSESTSLSLMNNDPKVQLQHMQAAEFVVAQKIEEILFQKVEAESKQFLTGAAALLGGGARAMTPAPNNKWEMPDLSNINPALLAPIPDSSMMLSLPPEPPKDKKKKKGKGKKGRGKSASSHKSKKKKKK